MLGKITVAGRELPCRVTMGAMLRFKRETGRDVGEMSSSDISDLITFMWCCVSSACAADGTEFGLTLEEFADRMDPGSLTRFYEERQTDGSKKK